MKHANISIFVPHVGCPNQCSFCDQRSISGGSAVPDGAFVRQVCAGALEQMGDRARAAEIAFFGGSFTAIDRPLMEELLGAASEFVGEGRFAGIRVSTRPDAVDGEILAALRAYGVSAVELGAQSMDDGVLRKNRRGHSASQTEEAADQIRAAGLELGLQMMVGLYGDSERGVWETARKIAGLTPDTVRVYPTVVLKNTMLAELYELGEYTPITVPEAVRISAGLLAFFEGRGIRVIRLGLHASRQVERDMLAGGYHPALRELCESHLFLLRFFDILERGQIPPGAVTIRVPRGAVSKATGQRRANVLELSRRGYRAKIVEDSALSGFETEITSV